ncbi:MAG TPA: DUF3568 family protein [Burkholderiales bacterium]|nr:DUF3568 family protein [Burkholderiales bacterium]
MAARRRIGLMGRGAAVAALAVVLAGCEPLALTAMGIGASTGVSHALGGITYRTFTVPLPKVKSATMTALGRMGIKVDGASKIENGALIKARATDRDIEIELEALSPSTTRMRTVAKKGLLYDSATSTEIILQTERILGNA